MKLPLPVEIPLTYSLLKRISAIDEFNGEWRGALTQLLPERLQSLRRIATIESVGSSTRIEGVSLSDSEVEEVMTGLQYESFRTRDEEEVAGYAYVTESIQEAWKDMPLTENLICQLHRDLLRFTSKDERHRGNWKTLANHVAAFNEDGSEIGIIFKTATPFETPQLMTELVEWITQEESVDVMHPLLRIAVFKVIFLAIHPFQDGNGRLSRVLTNLMLLRSGYSYASYISLESVIEVHKGSYYRALRTTQKSFTQEAQDDEGAVRWEPWILFFLTALESQIKNLQRRLREDKTVEEKPVGQLYQAPQRTPAQPLPEDLSPLAGHLFHELQNRQTLSVAEAVDALSKNRNTLKEKFRELVDAGYATLHGKGRGAHYRPKSK